MCVLSIVNVFMYRSYIKCGFERNFKNDTIKFFMNFGCKPKEYQFSDFAVFEINVKPSTNLINLGSIS